MHAILHPTPPMGQARSHTTEPAPLGVDVDPPSGGSAATSLDTWEHLGISHIHPQTDMALSALSDVTNSPQMKRVIRAFALSGDVTLEKQGRRMAECSTKMQINATATRASMCPNHCDVRACANCNIHRSRKALRTWGLVDDDRKRRGKRLRFVTLTIRAVKGRSHAEARDLIKKTYVKFWRRKLTRHYMDGAVRKLETTWNEEKGWWHVHYHLVYEGKFWPQAELEDHWRSCVGGVEDGGADIRAAYDPKELFKYTLKHHGVPDAQLVEWAQDMQGARELDFLGTWRGLSAEDDQDEATAEDLEAFRQVCEDPDVEATEVRVVNEARLTWVAWGDDPDFPDYVVHWARERLREVIGDVNRFKEAADRRRYRPG